MEGRLIIKKPVKKFLILAVLFVLLYPFYFAFWPRYTFITEGYEDIDYNNSNLNWDFMLSATVKSAFKKNVDEYGSPYYLTIWICSNDTSKLSVNKMIIQNAKETIYQSERIENKSFVVKDDSDCHSFYYKNIPLDYLDYNLLFEYSLEIDGNLESHSFKVPLARKYTNIKVSWWDMALGI